MRSTGHGIVSAFVIVAIAPSTKRCGHVISHAFADTLGFTKRLKRGNVGIVRTHARNSFVGEPDAISVSAVSP